MSVCMCPNSSNCILYICTAFGISTNLNEAGLFKKQTIFIICANISDIEINEDLRWKSS